MLSRNIIYLNLRIFHNTRIMRRKSIFVIIVAIFIGIQTFAAPVSMETAKTIAQNFYKSQYFRSFGSIPTYHALTTNAIWSGTKVAYYVCNFSQGGFVLISADDQSFPIIGYSLEENFPETNISPSLDNWMNDVVNQIRYSSEKSNVSVYSNLWIDLLNDDPSTLYNKSEIKSVSPLLTLRWDQGVPYNNQCPPNAQGPGGHCLTGCVATAMAQIMKFWNYPERGRDSILYTGNNNLVFENTYYNWDAMTNTASTYSPDSTKDAIAELMFHCGVTVNMMYGPDASGTFTELVPDALTHYFRYHPAAGYVLRKNVTDFEWDIMVRDNLDNGIPVLYSGSGTGGHAFVCDGYTDTCFYHMNWGWSGAGNGYFYYNDLSPGSSDFSQGQGAVFNIMPYFNSYCKNGRVLTDVYRTFEDGSLHSLYWNNTNCDWLITPPEPLAKINLQFLSFKTEDNNDILNIYDGDNSSAPLLGSYSGIQNNINLQSSQGKLYLEFVTNGSVQKEGWEAYYDARFCKEGGVMTGVYGNFSDGSENLDYLNNSRCEWLISPPNANEKITLKFTQFITELNQDFVTIYDGDETSDSILGKYSGSTLPDSIVSTQGKMLVIFESNSTVRSGGWDAHYYQGNVDVQENLLDEYLFSFYPNPVENFLNLKLENGNSWNGNISIYSITGDLLFSKKISIESNQETKINISEIPNGLYFMKALNSEGGFIKKFIKN